MTQPGKPDDNPCRPRHFKPICAPAPTHGPGRTALEVSHSRLIVMGALFVLAFLVISGQLFDVMELRPLEVPLAHRPSAASLALHRADITDRNGVLLATTLKMPSLYANPKQIGDKGKVAVELHQIFPDLPAGKLAQTLNQPKVSFVWIKHYLTPRQQIAVNALGEPGLQFLTEAKRVYPKGNLFSHVVGFVNDQDQGVAGVEAGLNKRLETDSSPLRLSVDARVQYILHTTIQHQMDEFSALHGFGVVMNVRNGEILALASLPDFDPNNLSAATPDELYNHATFGTYEMGSMFKIFNTAMVLAGGVATIDTKFNAVSPIHFGGFTIHDFDPERRWLTVAQIFEYSSNIGSAKMAVAAGAQRQQDFLGRVGLLNAPQRFQIPAVAQPQYPNPWRKINVMTVAFGQGISVSALQMATAATAVINGGVLYRPTLLIPPTQPPGERVLPPWVSFQMRKLLRLVVTGGTGKYADAKGYVVGGKTGTAEEVRGRTYAKHQLLSSFIGVFPMQAPRFLVLICIDQPHGIKKTYGFATGGWVAAPGVKRVIEEMAPLEGIAPVDESNPAIVSELSVDSTVPKEPRLAAE
ncbi:MAG: penicillin-binding transpeptidase domain-containing protein [Stellaceae bacterium]